MALPFRTLVSFQALNSHFLEEKKQTAAAVTFHPVEHIPLFHSTIPFHHSSPVIVDYRVKGLHCKKWVFCYTPLGVSQVVSYYTPPHSMISGVLLQLWTTQLTVSHNTKHCQYKNPHGMRRSVIYDTTCDTLRGV